MPDWLTRFGVALGQYQKTKAEEEKAKREERMAQAQIKEIEAQAEERSRKNRPFVFPAIDQLKGGLGMQPPSGKLPGTGPFLEGDPASALKGALLGSGGAGGFPIPSPSTLPAPQTSILSAMAGKELDPRGLPIIQKLVEQEGTQSKLATEAANREKLKKMVSGDAEFVQKNINEREKENREMRRQIHDMDIEQKKLDRAAANSRNSATVRQSAANTSARIQADKELLTQRLASNEKIAGTKALGDTTKEAMKTIGKEGVNVLGFQIGGKPQKEPPLTRTEKDYRAAGANTVSRERSKYLAAKSPALQVQTKDLSDAFSALTTPRELEIIGKAEYGEATPEEYEGLALKIVDRVGKKGLVEWIKYYVPPQKRTEDMERILTEAVATGE